VLHEPVRHIASTIAGVWCGLLGGGCIGEDDVGHGLDEVGA
jgi:hypothetical protein